MLKRLTPHILVIASTLFALVMNMLAIALPLNGLSTQELADAYPVYFIPANYVFLIWTVIYVGLILFSIYQILPRGQRDERINKIRTAVIISNVLNGLWIVWWHYQLLPLSTVTIFALLVTLIYIYSRLPFWKDSVGKIFRVTTLLTFSIYLGWLSVATISNTSVQLYALNWTGLGIAGEYWAALMCLVAADLAINLIWIRRDYPYALVIIWAVVGIFVKFSNAPALAVTALIAASLVTISVLFALYRQIIRRVRKQLATNKAEERKVEDKEVNVENKTEIVEAEIVEETKPTEEPTTPEAKPE